MQLVAEDIYDTVNGIATVLRGLRNPKQSLGSLPQQDAGLSPLLMEAEGMPGNLLDASLNLLDASHQVSDVSSHCAVNISSCKPIKSGKMLCFNK